MQGGFAMKTVSRIALALAVVLLAATAAFAADAAAPVTLSGKIACGHCTLKLEGLKDCQDVLVVTGADGKASYYYVVKNDVAKKFGHQCKGEKAATVTGTVTEKDGKHWIDATKMEAQG
jgi:hypothetical protein